MMRKTIICARCGREVEARGNQKKYCDECAKIAADERSRKHSEERRREERENAAIVMAAFAKPEKNPKLELQKAQDKELDARIAKQNKQCRKCDYCYKDGSIAFCDYISHEGHSRDRGEGPGKCGSFKPRRKWTKAERMERVRKSLLRSEANNAHHTGESMREANQL